MFGLALMKSTCPPIVTVPGPTRRPSEGALEGMKLAEMARAAELRRPRPGTTVDDCGVIDLPKIADIRGNLTVVEGEVHVPFQVARVYWLYDVPGGESRGGHAHRDLEQFIISASGSFEVVVDDGRRRKSFSLSRSYYGLYVPTLIWRELVNFSSGSVCLVLASARFEEDDYFRDYHEFRDYRESLHSAFDPRPYRD